MAVVSRITTIVLDSGTGTRTFQATANQQDTPAGATYNITITETTSGLTPPSAPDTLTLSIRIDSGNTIVYTAALPSRPITGTLYMTDNADFNGSPRSGTLRIRLQAVRTSGLASTQYNVNSDNTSGESLPAGYSVEQRDQGWVRATTTATVHLSNVAAGVEPTVDDLPASFADSIYHRVTLGAQPYQTWSVTHRLLDSPNGVVRRSASSSSSTDTFDRTFSGTSTSAGRVNNGFPTALTTEEGDALLGSSSLTSQMWTLLTSLTEDTIDVDPRLTVRHHLQIDDATFGTPPSAKDAVPHGWVVTDLPFTGARLTNARGEGVDGINYRETLRDAAQILPDAINRVDATATRGGEAGWSSVLASTEQSKPGGGYDHTIAITTSDATGLEANGTETYTLEAPPKSFYVAVVSGGPINKATHVHSGGAFQAGVSLVDTQSWRRVPVASAVCALARLQDTGPTAGLIEYLAADGSWVPLPPQDFTLDNIHTFPLTETAPSTGVWIKTWLSTETADWGAYDVFVIGNAIDLNGVSYPGASKEIVVGVHNPHDVMDAPKFDALQFGLHGVIGQH